MTIDKQSIAIIVGSLIAFIGGGWLLDSAPQLGDARATLQSLSEADAQIRSGRMGEQLRKAHLLSPSASDEKESKTERRYGALGSKEGIHQRLVNAGLVKPLDSTTSTLPEHHSPGVPTLSLWVDESDLYDPDRGIVPNWTEKWERDAQVSYFEEGKLVFSTKCGIRLHGGTTRDGNVMKTRGLDWRSYRLKFRKKYGRDAIPAGTVLPEEAGPIVALTVRGNHFVPQALAFDIARKVGNLVPETRVARLILNGKPLHAYSLIDHTGRKQIEARLGRDNFVLASVFMSDPVESKPYFDLRDSIRAFDSANVREQAEALVDLDDYMRHMFVLLYCAPADWGEGSCFLDLADESPRWRWIHWDLDNSFRVVVSQRIDEGDVEPWDKGFLDLALKPFVKARKQARVFLFQSLVEHDPEFRYDFARLVQELLNHDVTVPFVRDAVEQYKPALFWGLKAKRAKREHPLQIFARKRPAAIRADLAEQFDLKFARRITVRSLATTAAKTPATIRIDGRDVALPYRGWYFPRFPIELSVPDALAERFSHWRVDGERADGRSIPTDLVSDGPDEGLIELVLKP